MIFIPSLLILMFNTTSIVAFVAGLLNIGPQQSQGNLVFRGREQSRTQSNTCARARMALALGKLNFSCAVIGLTCMPTKPEPLNLGVPVVNFPRANAILARAQALLWVRDWAVIGLKNPIG